MIRRLLTTDFYSASALDLEMVGCFFGHQEIEFSPRKTPADRRSSDEPAKSIPSELKTMQDAALELPLKITKDCSVVDGGGMHVLAESMQIIIDEDHNLQWMRS